MDLREIQFRPGGRASAGALNAMVAGIVGLQRIGQEPETNSSLMAVKSQAAIAVGEKGYVKRVYFQDETSSAPATVTEIGNQFYAVNLGPSPLDAGELCICFNTAGTYPVLFHTEAPPFAAADVNYYLTGSASADVANYKLAQSTPTVTEATISATITGADQVIEEWVTPAAEPNISQLQAGAVDIHLHAAKTSGTKSVTIKGLIYKRTSGGSETLLGTSAAGTSLNNIITFQDLYASVSETAFDASDRLVLKITATPTGGGTNPTVALYVGGQYASLFECSAISQDSGAGVTPGGTFVKVQPTTSTILGLSDFTADGTPYDLDLSGTVTTSAKAILLSVFVDESNEWADDGGFSGTNYAIPGPISSNGMLVVPCSAGVINYAISESATTASVAIFGYWT